MTENNEITLLSIESSCDDTGIAIVRKNGKNTHIIANKVESQVETHRKTGGVVPNIAGEMHTKALPILIDEAMKEANMTPDDISAIAVTVGPGLMPALLAGVHIAQEKAREWNKKIVPVHHLEGHIYSALLEATHEDIFPALALIVSGGNTMLIEVKGHLQYKILGKTRDDAIGEAFDKVARMLGLPYPGGPEISKLAKQGNSDAFPFPIPMKTSGDLDFSYSGLKTAVKYAIEEVGKESNADIAASFQKAAIESLIWKTNKALEEKPYNTLLLAGGVAANHELQKAMNDLAKQYNIPLATAPKALQGDNAAMIGQAGIFAHEAGRIKKERHIDATARLNIETLKPQLPVCDSLHLG